MVAHWKQNTTRHIIHSTTLDYMYVYGKWICHSKLTSFNLITVCSSTNQQFVKRFREHIAELRRRWTCVCCKNVLRKMFQKCVKSFLNDLYLISMRQTGWKHHRKRKRNSLETETTVGLHDDTTFVLQLMAKPPLHRVYIVAWIYASVYESRKRYGVMCSSSSTSTSDGGGGGGDRTNMFQRCRIATRGNYG